MCDIKAGRAGVESDDEMRPAVGMASEASVGQRTFIVTMLLVRPQLIWLVQHLF